MRPGAAPATTWSRCRDGWWARRAAGCRALTPAGGPGRPHPPTTRQLGHRPVRVGTGEAETGQDLGYFGLQGVPAELLELRLDLAVPDDEIVPAVGGPTELVLELPHGPGQFRQVARAGLHMGADGSLIDLAQILGQVPDPSIAGLDNGAGVGLEQARHYLQQSRLAGPVAAHQRDAATRGQVQGHALEELAGAVGLGQARRGQGHRPTLRGRAPGARVQPIRARPWPERPVNAANKSGFYGCRLVRPPA